MTETIDWSLIEPEIEPDAAFIGEGTEPTSESEDATKAEFPPIDEKIAKPPPRKRGAVSYEKKMRVLFSNLMRIAVQNEATVADGAALIVYSPGVAEKLGDLAAEDANVARAIDFITEGTENPYISVIVASAPLVLQLVRNHEPILEPAQRGWKIPFTERRIQFRFGIKLGRLRVVTHDPKALEQSILRHPAIAESLAKQGIQVATPRNARQRKSTSQS